MFLFDVAGSSPLARGLRIRTADSKDVLGIIPARAGFTHRRSTPRLRSEDHPRSRGVYSATPTSSAGAAGSSPLARGLLITGLMNVVGIRIIPARAGFTAVDQRHHIPPRDHPRSRGVYQPDYYSRNLTLGSSPLARGLQLHCF